MSFGIKPVGIYADESVKTDPNLKDLDLTGIEILGEEWGKIDVEKAAGLRPDLIVGRLVAGGEGAQRPGGRRRREEQEARRAGARRRASPRASRSSTWPRATRSSPRAWAPRSTPRRSPRTRRRSRTAVDRFKEAVAAKPGLTAAAMSPADDKVYVANPEYAPELLDFQKLGPRRSSTRASPDPGFPYWENLSWENADKYQPDLILWDGRSYTPTANAEWGKKQPTWFSIKAAKAGAVVAWPAYWLHTYGHFATELDKLTEAIKAADPDCRQLTDRSMSSADSAVAASLGPRAGARRARRGARPGRVPQRHDGLPRDRPDRGAARPRRPRRATAPSTTRSRWNCASRARCSASSWARPSASPAPSCRASPATRSPTPASWASTPARPPSSSSPSPCSASAASARTSGSRSPGAAAATAAGLRDRLARPGGRDAGQAGAGRRGRHRRPRLGHHRHRHDQHRRPQRAALLAGRVRSPAGTRRSWSGWRRS